MVWLRSAADASRQRVDEPSLLGARVIAGETHCQRLGHRAIDFPPVNRVGVRVQRDVQSIVANPEREERRRIGTIPRAMTHARGIHRQIVRKLACRGYARRGMHIVAVVHRPERLTQQRAQRLIEVLRVAPGREGRVFAQRALRNRLLRAHGALRVDDGERRQADAREQHGQRDTKAERRGERETRQAG